MTIQEVSLIVNHIFNIVAMLGLIYMVYALHSLYIYVSVLMQKYVVSVVEEESGDENEC